jgi:serine protease Do
MRKAKVLATFFVSAGFLAACPAEQVSAVPAERTAPQPAETPAITLQDFSTAIAGVSERAVPSVVNISTSRTMPNPAFRSPFENDPFFRHFEFGPGQQQQQHPRQQPKEQSLGSGVIVRKDGTILTNNHVIQGADEIRVTMSDGRSFEAKLVGTDPKSDLAVLKMQNAPADLTPLPFGDSNKLRLGEVVIAIGNPFGVGQTVTMGIVSALGRANMGIVDYEDFIQTDAAINPGNSGGALVNLKGELVGINTAILSRSGGYQGIGFAIPSDMVESIIGSLIEEGKVVRGWLGVMIQDLTPELAKALELEQTSGVLVSEIMPDTPAAKAGIRAQDVIIEVAGKKMSSSAQLRREVAAHRPGSKVEMKIVRDGDEDTVTVELGQLPESEGELGALRGGGESGVLEGLAMRDLDEQLRRRFDVAPRIDGGAAIVGVDPNSAAARAGLRPGDVIIEANRKQVESVEDLRYIVGKKDSQALLRVHRQGASIFLLLKK